MEEISPALLGAIQQIIFVAIREQVVAIALARVTTLSYVDAPEEEAEEGVPAPLPLADRRQEVSLPDPQEVPPQWLARFEHFQKGLPDVRYHM
ncbi:UNVERIFIED_CONTAM: hypothetical protein Sradi_2980000 [Sesamum radiatum]|uniref:Uncharacterized protein n=1 Tax=Sesamum radiatum TaxID=300843 RepID=A0AAW2S0G5_SESRA